MEEVSWAKHRSWKGCRLAGHQRVAVQDNKEKEGRKRGENIELSPPLTPWT